MASWTSTSRSPSGEVFGFLGPNGAGKTTTIRTLLDLIRPTSGRAFVFGIETTTDPVAIHRRIGYIPGEFALYDRLTGGQTIDYFANLRGGVDRGLPAIPDRTLRHRSRRRKFKEYSKGNKQKIGLVIALQHRPGAADPRRADVGPRPARPAVLLRSSSARPRPKAGRSSSRATSCRRSNGPATGSRSSATGSSSRSTASRASATSPITRSSCGSSTASRPKPSAACPASRTSRSRTTRCGCGCPARSRRSSRRPRGTSCSTSSAVSRPSRRRSWPSTGTARGGARMTANAHSTTVATSTLEPDLRPRDGLCARRCATRAWRSSSSAAWSPGMFLVDRRRVRRGLQHRRVAPGARRPRQEPAAGHGRASTATPFPSHIDTLGGSIAWKGGDRWRSWPRLWSVLALSGTLAGEARRGSLEFVATTPLGMRRIAIEKLAAHLTAMAILVSRDRSAGVVSRQRVRDAARATRSRSRAALGFAFWLGVVALASGSVAFALAPLVGRGCRRRRSPARSSSVGTSSTATRPRSRRSPRSRTSPGGAGRPITSR